MQVKFLALLAFVSVATAASVPRESSKGQEKYFIDFHNKDGRKGELQAPIRTSIWLLS